MRAVWNMSGISLNIYEICMEYHRPSKEYHEIAMEYHRTSREYHCISMEHHGMSTIYGIPMEYLGKS